ncbi:MAG: N(5)-(carboxyethyl)ornithine synthase [Gemmatimonadota bacterium]|nr:N(5)-(carboxyethyl)ornithine synthase [Gemmatimonadota bacterium]
MSELRRFGVIGTSRKPDERRVPIHPDHFDRLPGGVAHRLVFEQGYGRDFDVSDDEMRGRFGGVAPRDEVLASCDGVVLPKPVEADLEDLAEGAVLWGWPHCVQQRGITDTAVRRRQTLLAFESMFLWRRDVRGMHLFYRNNELAGYAAVQHALSIQGECGHFGRPLRAVVLSFGSVSRGAIRALNGVGVQDIEIFTRRPPWEVRDRMSGGRFGRLVRADDGLPFVVEPEGARRDLLEVFAGADVIVNAVLQDTDDPLMYMAEGNENHLRPGSLIVDVSCDRGMGFPFARSTSFADPVLRVGPAWYYAVDHTPSWLWRSATWEISEVVVAWLERVLHGPDAWADDETLRRAVEVHAGTIRNPKILSYRERVADSGS